MKTSKYILGIHDKYLPKVQYMINVINSCTTPEQLVSCRKWTKEVMSQCLGFESEQSDSLSTSLALIREFETLKGIIKECYNRKLNSFENIFFNIEIYKY